MQSHRVLLLTIHTEYILSANNFTSLLIWMPFTSFSCLVSLARAPGSSRLGVLRVGILVSLVPDLSRKVLNVFTIEYDSHAFVIYSFYYVEVHFYYT